MRLRNLQSIVTWNFNFCFYEENMLNTEFADKYKQYSENRTYD